MFFQLTSKLIFPDPALADADGLLAIGGDLSKERLLLAYNNGIFPWYAEGEPVLWFSPHQRFVLFPAEVKISNSMKQIIKSAQYQVTWNKAFTEVITACSKIARKGQKGTWINSDMIKAYINLHENGIAHSVEVWNQDGTLAGGLYGVAIRKVFCGESMFSIQPNTSKLALINLSNSGQYDLIDCQVYTPHLQSMGARFISRHDFITLLGVQN